MQRKAPAGRGRPSRGGLIAAALACAFGAGCSSPLEGLSPTRDTVARGLPPAELSGVIFEGFRGEQREVEVTADAAVIDLVERVADLGAVTLRFSEDSRGPIEISAPHGKLALDQDDFELSGGVVGSAQAGERFSTETLRYVAASRELVSDAPVELERANLALRADGMKLGLDARRLRLVGRVEARVVPR